MAWRIVRKSKGIINRLLGRTLSPQGKVAVGFPKGGAQAQKAIWQEFGTRGGASGGGWGGPIPERPFMRNSMRNNRDKYRQAMLSSASKLIYGEVSMHEVLAKLGAQAQGDIQKEITSLRSPPNSPVTIARKGSSNPLIDTGAMRQAVTWEIR